MSYENLKFEAREVDEDSVVILKALQDAGGSFVSGSLLAGQLGVSRPAIHGKLDKLRGEGFVFEAVRNRGYRLAKEPGLLHPALLRCALDRLGNGMRFRYFPVVDSTNSEAERRCASGEPSPFAIVSSCQTNGRGRLGRTWCSDSAENLYLSLLFEPDIPPQQLQHFTLWAGICICRMLQENVAGAPLKVKWPNDLHCGGRKFAGMLTEAKLDADRIRSIVFGLGLNVNGNPNEFPDEVRPLATSLRAIGGRPLPLNELAAAVIHAVGEAYEICIQKKDTPQKLSEAWGPLDALAGRQVTAVLAGKEITGVADGIDESGALRLRTRGGRVEAVRAGDVTLRKE